jgi:tRNA(Ile)-lysidine synthase
LPHHSPRREGAVLLEIARKTIEYHHMVERGDRVLVAVSGGPDSVALLDVLVTLRSDRDLNLHVAHLNHLLRPDAAADAEFVRALAAERGLPVAIESADVRALAAREKRSIEEAARNVRREFLLRTAKTVQADRVALGHHADDRVETVLMRILRGTGVDGLAGIRPVTPPFIRPLFDATRAQIEAYISDRGLPYREDPSNRDPAFLRNRIRHEIVPLLEHVQPGFRAAVLRLAELAWKDRSYLLMQSALLLREQVLVEHSPGRVALRLAALSRIDSPALRWRVVRDALRFFPAGSTDIEQTHIEAIMRLAAEGKSGDLIHLPRGIIAERGYGVLILRVGEAAADEPVGEFVLEVPGETAVMSLNVTIVAELLSRAAALPPVEEPPNVAQLDYSATPEPLLVRTWRRGDRFTPLGMTGSMKVHDFFVNQKIPRDERRRVPIVTAGEEIAWVVGMRIDDRFKVTDATETVLRLEARAGGPR